MFDGRRNDPNRMNRRDFNLLSLAAMGGLAAGSSLDPRRLAASDSKTGTTVAKKERHICRGLNSCKGNGADVDLNGDGKIDKNACAGQGACATVKHSSCAGQNECKGLGGCGETAGSNACKGMGSCHVPMHAGPWKQARRFEAKMKKARKKFGNPPPIGKTPQGKANE